MSNWLLRELSGAWSEAILYFLCHAHAFCLQWGPAMGTLKIFTPGSRQKEAIVWMQLSEAYRIKWLFVELCDRGGFPFWRYTRYKAWSTLLWWVLIFSSEEQRPLRLNVNLFLRDIGRLYWRSLQISSLVSPSMQTCDVTFCLEWHSATL